MDQDDFRTLIHSADESELRRRAHDITLGLGFEYFMYANGPRNGNSTFSFTKVITTYPPAWVELYAKAGFAAIDPTVRHCMEHRIPWEWDKEALQRAGTGIMYEEACRHGLSDGISIPLHDPVTGNAAGIALAFDGHNKPRVPRKRGDLAQTVLFAQYFQEAVSRLSVPYLHSVDSVLTRSEVECLAWLSDGLEADEIAARMALAPDQVGLRLERARTKLGARTLPQAVALAFAGGQLHCVPGHPVRPATDDTASLADSPHNWALREVEREIARARDEQAAFAVGVLDLDHFRRVNNALGHEAGNALLAEVAERLRFNLPPGGRMAGLDGDAFLLLLPETRCKAAANRLLQCLRTPVTVADRPFTITGSLGIARFPQDDESAQALLRGAEISLYRAKERGRDRVEFFALEMGRKAEQSAIMEGELRRALDREELSLHYQPLIDGASGRIRGVEALCRWNNALLGQVPPEQFISLAEQSNLIRILDEWVFVTACCQIKSWRERGWTDLVMAVNVCPTRFLEADIVARTLAMLDALELPYACLEIEITERLLMDSDPVVRARLKELRHHGVRFAIDDFGTGHSSLSYLGSLPVDTLKIDRSFIQDVATCSERAVLVEAIVAMAGKLGLHVVAEGVEQESERAFLMSCGCDTLQGYLLGRPAPAEEIEKLLGACRT